jgi:hypothetical protein
MSRRVFRCGCGNESESLAEHKRHMATADHPDIGESFPVRDGLIADGGVEIGDDIDVEARAARARSDPHQLSLEGHLTGQLPFRPSNDGGDGE